MNTIDDNRPHPTYTTLRSIEDRKAQLLREIRKDNDKMNKLRRQLFAKSEPAKGGRRMQTLMTTSVGLLDGALFAWKLYRKFRK
jgi:hypothetical protein